MKRIIKELFLLLDLNVTTGSKYKYEKYKILELYDYREQIEYFNARGVKFKNLERFLDYENFRFVIKGFPIFLELQNKAHAEIEFCNSSKEVLIKIDKQKFYVQTYEEFVILKEIFIEGIYNIISKQSFCFIDIGMNVAFTSLYMSKNVNVKSVYSFEPFNNTYKQGLRNIEINNSKKINAFCFGLGKHDHSLLLDYSESFRGSMGIAGIPFYLKGAVKPDEVVKQEVEIRDIAEVLSEIIAKEKDAQIVIKMDCEGAEYDLIKRLDEKQLLKGIKSLMIEWHLLGPNEIEEILRENNFCIFSFAPFRKDISMIYAVKN